MVKASVKIIITAVLALLVGYVLGVFINFPNLKGDNLKGDIGKASKFSQKATPEEIKAAEERLQNDTNYYKGVVTTLSLVNERIDIFSTLVSMTTSVCEGVEGLRPVLAQVQGMQGMVANAQSACSDALNAVAAIAKGEKADYEQTLNNVSLAYALVSRSSKVAKNVVNSFDQLIGSKPTDNSEMAFVRDEWVRFSATEAAIQGDEIALNYWGNQNSLLTNDQTLNLLLNGERFIGKKFIIIGKGGKEEDQQCLKGEERLISLTAPISCAFLFNGSERIENAPFLEDMKKLSSGYEFSMTIKRNIERLDRRIVRDIQSLDGIIRFSISSVRNGDFLNLLGGDLLSFGHYVCPSELGMEKG